MVIKAKSDNPIKPLRNVKSFDVWSAPIMDSGKAGNFRQPTEEPEEKSEEMISAEALQTIRDNAYQEAFNQGRDEGLASAKSEIDQKSETLSLLINNLSEPLEACQEQAQQEILELAFSLAKQIVRRELKQDPSQLIAVIREAIKQLPMSARKIKIQLNPDDASIVKSLLTIDKDSGWELIDDPAMEQGNCLLKTENSIIDASIERQVAVLFSRIVGGQRSGEVEKNADNVTQSIPQTNEPPNAD